MNTKVSAHAPEQGGNCIQVLSFGRIGIRKNDFIFMFLAHSQYLNYMRGQAFSQLLHVLSWISSAMWS
jgi:hypothetical protein